MEKVYEHSGKLGLGPVLVLAAGIVASLVLSLVYAYVTVYSPIAGYVSLLFVAGFGFALAFVMSTAGKLAKCRHSGFMALAGVLVGLFAIYCDFAAFESVLLAKSAEAGEEVPGYLDFLINPGAVWEIGKLINETGWYSIKSATPSGIVLGIFWGIEAVVVLGGTFLGAVGSIADEVFCESCNRWCEDHSADLVLSLPEEKALTQRISEGSLEAMESLEAPFVGQAAYLGVQIKQCESCQATASYQVKLVQHGIDKEGKPTVESTDLSPQFETNQDGVRRLVTLAARPRREPAKDEGGAEEEEGAGDSPAGP